MSILVDLFAAYFIGGAVLVAVFVIIIALVIMRVREKKRTPSVKGEKAKI